MSKTNNVESINLPIPQEPSTALKFDDGKADLSQVTWELVEGLARVRMFGEKKYARDNWKKGFKVTRSLSACLRHIFKFLAGETNDTESGLCHLFHAVACLEHAIYDLKYHPQNDDRTQSQIAISTSTLPSYCAQHGIIAGVSPYLLDSTNCLCCKPLIAALKKDQELFGGVK